MKKYIILLLITLLAFTSVAYGASYSDQFQWYSTTAYHPEQTDLNGSNITGTCTKVVDGDTIYVSGLGKVRFVGVNTPERGQPGYKEAKEYVYQQCYGKQVTIDVDNAKHFDKYNRTLGVVYVNNTNINQQLLKNNLAEVMYIPPSEFDPYSWQ